MRIISAGLFALAGLWLSLLHEARGTNVASIAALAPPGWHVLQTAEGDLNGDGLIDAAAVFTKAAPDAEAQTQSEDDLAAPRRLLLAMRDQRNELHRAIWSDHVVLCRFCGVTSDEPLRRFAIAHGALVIEQNTLNACEAAYAHQIQFDKGRWRVRGEIRVRELRTGRQRIIKFTRPKLLAEFDIARFNACGADE